MGWESIITKIPHPIRKKLLIPGPVNTKFNLVADMAPREKTAIGFIKELRSNLLELYKVSSKTHTAILLHGSGTACNESVMRTFPNQSPYDILSNGVYGNRFMEIAEHLPLNPNFFYYDAKKKIKLDKKHKCGKIVSMVHHETGSGIRNDIEQILDYYPTETITHIDAISTFGGVPFELEKHNVDFFVGAGNKCLHGFAGISFVIAKKDTLESLKKNKSSLALNLYEEWKYMEETNQFRFTPPIQIVNYLNLSVRDIIYGDGIEGRYNKYKRLNKIARDILDPKLISVIDPGESDYLMTLYKHPDPTFNFQEFKENMRHLNIILQDSVIFSNDLIRIGNIGEWTEQEFAKTLNLLVNKLEL